MNWVRSRRLCWFGQDSQADDIDLPFVEISSFVTVVTEHGCANCTPTLVAVEAFVAAQDSEPSLTD